VLVLRFGNILIRWVSSLGRTPSGGRRDFRPPSANPHVGGASVSVEAAPKFPSGHRSAANSRSYRPSQTGPSRAKKLRPLQVHYHNIDIFQRLVSAAQVWLGLGRLSLISTDFCPPAFGEEAARQPCGGWMHVISHAEKPWISIPCSAEVRSETAFSSAANTARNRIAISRSTERQCTTSPTVTVARAADSTYRRP